MDLEHLISGLAIERRGSEGRADVALRICDITEDSRTVMPGSLYVARKGEKSDGRAYIKGAVAGGAVAVLTERPTGELQAAVINKLASECGPAALLLSDNVQLAMAQIAERFFGSPSSKLDVCAVTGTNGKTTVAYLVYQLLNNAGTEAGASASARAHAESKRCGLMGTVCIDDGTEVAPATLTTPPALEISRTLARMAESGCKAAAMEASSHSLHQHRVGALAIRVGVFTNLTHDHLDYHGTMDAYGAAKAMLFAMLPSAAAAGSAVSGGVAIVNQDDPWHERMIEGCKARIVRCGIKAREAVATPVADWHASVIKADARTTTIRVRGPWDGVAGIAAGPASDGEGVLTIELPLIGEHNVMNALQAAATAYEMGLSVGALAAGLGRINAPPGRLEPVTAAGAPLTVYVDYAHTDDALERVLLTVRKAMGRTRTSAGAGAELHCVFGCGGDRDRSKRPKMGRVASMLADRVIVTSDNPRSEEPRGIIEQVAAGISADLRAGVVIEQDRARAISAAVASMQAGDVLVIAGKGHEDYQIVSDGQGGTVKNHFDDRHVAATALVKRGVAVVPHFARIVTKDGSNVGFGSSAGGPTGAGGKRGGR